MQVDETVDELTNRVDESEEKAQMDDLISRQEAIRTFMGKVHDDYPILSDAMIGILEQLPTVNPQEPCDVSDTNVGKIDAVSRHAAIEKIHWLGIDNDTAIMCDLAIRALPPVTPKQRTGHWITTRTFMHDGEFYCDKCNCDAPNNEKWDYCPNCGVKMVEPQESEVSDADSD